MFPVKPISLLLGCLLVLGGAAAAAESEPLLSLAEVERQASVLVEQTGQAVEAIEGMRDDAESAGDDPVLLRCVSERLTAANGFLRVRNQVMERLAVALQAADVDAANHHLSLLSVVAQRMENLRMQAEQCSGDVLRYSGSTQQQFSADEPFPGLDPADEEMFIREELDFFLERPPEATPFD